MNRQRAKEKFPLGIKIISWATGIRWAGWGLSDALIAILIFSLTKSYSESGLLRSSYDLFFILALPVAGYLADRISLRLILLIGLWIYPFIGLAYFLAASLGASLFILLARGLNGISYALDLTGRKTYVMRTSTRALVSEAFGYFDTIAVGLYLIGLLISAAIAPHVALKWLFLVIIPTDFVALIMVARLREKRKIKPKKITLPSLGKILKKIYTTIFHDAKHWGKGMKTIGFVTFFMGFIESAGIFFVPIFAFAQGQGLSRVILLTALTQIPAIFGERIGRFADKNRYRTLIIGLKLVIILFVILAFYNNYFMQIMTAFAVGLILELVTLSDNGIITRIVKRNHYGRTNGELGMIGNLGSLIAPATLGLAIDSLGAKEAMLLVAGCGMLILLIVFHNRRVLT